jgi:putative GTP pyrophosphokinase
MLEIETKFRVLSQEFSLEQDYNPIETIKSRLKSMDSIVEKLQRKGLPLELESIENNLKDVAGIRVICPFLSDIYRMASCLMEQDDIVVIEKKDYIKNPKKNGYRSLHLIVETPIFLQKEKRMMKVEVQFRTIAMDFWASLEHRMHYKKNLDEKMQEMLVAELRDCAEESANLDIRMETVKDYIEENTEKTQKYS